MVYHQIINGDCLEGISQMDSNTFDLALIDPPYFDYKTGHRKEGKAHKFGQSMEQQSREDQLLVIQKCVNVLKPDSAFFVFTNWENIWWMQRPFEGIFRNMIVWDKGNWSAGDLKGSFGNQYEIIFLGSKGKWEFKEKREADIWLLPRVGGNRIHATEKPIDLYRKIILNSTEPGAWILDPYLGSGASVIAALETGRNIVGYELDKYYHEKILERVELWKKGNK